MRKVLACIFAVFVFAPVRDAGAAAISRAVPSASDTSAAASAREGGTSRGAYASSGTTASRGTVAARAPATSAADHATVRTRDVSRGSGEDAAATPSRGMSARSAAAADMTARDKLDAAVHTVGRNARVTAAGVNNDPAVRRSGVSLRPSTAEVGGRAKIAGTNMQTGSNVGDSVRALQSRAATTTQRETITEAKERLEQTAELNKSCQEQYNDCMDQFCAVIDSNQKRCSCSANLSRYTKVETAVKDANTQLNDVAQRIRYVGLSADEIRAIMSATEAEEALSGARDTTETRNMLEDIEALIKNPSSTNSAGSDGFSTLDINLDFSDSTDLFNLDFLNNNSGNLSNLRGTDLYNAAKKRCNSILTQCKDAGATSAQITANYDLAIDKDCIAYEQGLNKMNETLVSNVRSANLMLQKARLAVLQNKNEYDAKGCIAALDNCMTDEMVCGEGYEKCLDPTKRYIDENGKVVLGEDITDIRDFMENYDNSKIDVPFLTSAAKKTVGVEACKKDVDGNGRTDDSGNPIPNGDGACAVKYLLQKIGTGVRTTDGGLCRAVLDKCQRYTYDSNSNYKPYNDIVLNYIQRAMVNIKAGQEKVISEYASSCMLDVAACYNQQVTQISAWTQAAGASGIKNVMSGACRNVALTCGYALYDGKKCKMEINGQETTNEEACYIEEVSKIFYQGMLCPENSTYVSVSRSELIDIVNVKDTCDGGQGRASLPSIGGGSISVCKPAENWTAGTLAELRPGFNSWIIFDNTQVITPQVVMDTYVNELCACKSGYEVWNSSCVIKCASGTTRNKTTGVCEKKN